MVAIMSYRFLEPTIKAGWEVQISEKCGAWRLGDAFKRKSMLDNGPVIAAFGAYLGIIVSARFAPGFTKR